MNDGDERTPERAARPSRVVRLVAFAASAGLVAIALLGIGLLRYPLLIAADRTSAPALIVTEAVRPASIARSRATSTRPVRERRPDEAPTTSAPLALPPVATEPPVITSPIWLQRPRNTARFYPRQAFMQGVEGQVVLDCMVEVSGRLDCSITSETPPDKGFGDAALAIATAHVMQPATQNGAPVRARYRIIVPFSTRH